jgi:hypothetical protein
MQWEAHQRLQLKAFWTTPGCIDVYLCRNELRDYVVLAERFDNPATSVTNAFELYAQQVCARFQLDAQRCLFFELYVLPAVKNRQIHRKFELDVCTPQLPGLPQTQTRWRPGQDPMREAILSTLTSQHILTDSYNVVKFTPESLLDSNNDRGPR